MYDVFVLLINKELFINIIDSATNPAYLEMDCRQQRNGYLLALLIPSRRAKIMSDGDKAVRGVTQDLHYNQRNVYKPNYDALYNNISFVIQFHFPGLRKSQSVRNLFLIVYRAGGTESNSRDHALSSYRSCAGGGGI